MEVAGTAVGVVSLGITVCQGLLNYYLSWKDFDDEVGAMMRPLETLTRTLRHLEDVLKSRVFPPESVRQLEESMTACIGTVEKLNRKLDKIIKDRENPTTLHEKARSQRHRLLYPFRKSTFARLEELISELRANVSLAMQTLHLDIAGASFDNIKDVKASVHAIGLSLNEMQLDNHRREIHSWLKSPDPFFNHNAACKKRQVNTGTWFLAGDQYLDWKTSPNSTLWLHGIPGCGKTVLCSTIIEDVRTSCPAGSALAIFYFDFNDGEKRSCTNLLRSLIVQLSSQSTRCPAVLSSLYSHHDNGKRTPTDDKLVETLKEIIGGLERIYIILDALDECAERAELLNLMEQLKHWNIQNLHTLVTSRREKYIEDGLESLVTYQTPIQDAKVHADIQAFIKNELRQDGKLRKKPEHIQKEIEEKLVKGAHGMFQWVVCQLDALKSCRRAKDVQDALNALPETLDETYDRILLGIAPKDRPDAIRILQWLVFSARPVGIDEVAEALAVVLDENPHFDPAQRLDDPRDVLELCSSLISVSPGPSEEGEVIKLAHYSVQEYLVSERIGRKPVSEYRMEVVAANKSITDNFLAYLLQFDKPDSIATYSRHKHPLAEYAAQFWSGHWQLVERSTGETNPLAMELFLSNRDPYLNWHRLQELRQWNLKPDLSKNSSYDFASPLLYATSYDLPQLVRQLLENGACPDSRTWSNFFKPLIAASGRGLIQIVELLLQEGADVNTVDGYQQTALLAAAVEGHDKIVRLLLEKGAAINFNNYQGRYGTALHAAAIGGHYEVAKLLLEKGANVNAEGGDYSTALQAAAADGSYEMVQLLLEKGAYINAECGRSGTALQVAALKGHYKIVQLLLEKGADVNAEGGSLSPALQLAAAWGHYEVVLLLLGNGANVNGERGFSSTPLYASTPLYKAAEGRYYEIVQLLLEKGAYINAKGGLSGTALQVAALKGQYEIVQLLLEKGADVNTEGGWYGTALTQAALMQHYKIVRLLLEKGANDHTGAALQTAAERGRYEVVQLLLENGVDVNAGAALQAAAAEGDTEIVRLLLENGADVNAGAALQAAVDKGHSEIAQLLLENGADVNALDDEGEGAGAIPAPQFQLGSPLC